MQRAVVVMVCHHLAVIVFVVNMGVARRRFMLSWGGAMGRVEQLRRR